MPEGTQGDVDPKGRQSEVGPKEGKVQPKGEVGPKGEGQQGAVR